MVQPQNQYKPQKQAIKREDSEEEQEFPKEAEYDDEEYGEEEVEYDEEEDGEYDQEEDHPASAAPSKPVLAVSTEKPKLTSEQYAMMRQIW